MYLHSCQLAIDRIAQVAKMDVAVFLFTIFGSTSAIFFLQTPVCNIWLLIYLLRKVILLLSLYEDFSIFIRPFS